MNHSPGIAEEELNELMQAATESLGIITRDRIKRFIASYRSLLEENKRITKEREKWEAEARLQYRLFNEEIDASRKLREEKEQVKKERDFYKNVRDPHETLLSLRSELAAKDKVLEWYGGGSEDGGENARFIINQYKEADTSEK